MATAAKAGAAPELPPSLRAIADPAATAQRPNPAVASSIMSGLLAAVTRPEHDVQLRRTVAQTTDAAGHFSRHPTAGTPAKHRAPPSVPGGQSFLYIPPPTAHAPATMVESATAAAAHASVAGSTVASGSPSASTPAAKSSGAPSSGSRAAGAARGVAASTPAAAAASAGAASARPGSTKKPLTSASAALASTYLPASFLEARLPAVSPGRITTPLPVAALPRAKSTRMVATHLAATAGASSSTAALEVFRSATAGLAGGPRERRAFLVKRRADEARVQQLRGIFAAHDEDRDGLLSRAELCKALFAIGVEPTPATQRQYFAAATEALAAAAAADAVAAAGPDSTIEAEAAAAASALVSAADSIDLHSFVRVTLGGIDAPVTTEPLIEALFAEFDKAQAADGAVDPTTTSAGSAGADGSTGRVPLATLLHMLCEVDSPTALNVDEVNELLKMTGIMSELRSRDQDAIYGTEVDYRALTRHMMFPLSRRGAGTAAATAGATATPSGAPSASMASGVPTASSGLSSTVKINDPGVAAAVATVTAALGPVDTIPSAVLAAGGAAAVEAVFGPSGSSYAHH